MVSCQPTEIMDMGRVFQSACSRQPVPPRAPPNWKVGGHVPPRAPWFRRHCMDNPLDRPESILEMLVQNSTAGANSREAGVMTAAQRHYVLGVIRGVAGGLTYLSRDLHRVLSDSQDNRDEFGLAMYGHGRENLWTDHCRPLLILDFLRLHIIKLLCINFVFANYVYISVSGCPASGRVGGKPGEFVELTFFFHRKLRGKGL